MLIFLPQFYHSSSFMCHVSPQPPVPCTSKRYLIPYNPHLSLFCHSQNFPLTVSIKFSKPFLLICNYFFMIFSMSVFFVGVSFTTSLLLPYPRYSVESHLCHIESLLHLYGNYPAFNAMQENIYYSNSALFSLFLTKCLMS